MQAQAADRFGDRKHGTGSAVLHREFRQVRDAGMAVVGSTAVGPPVARSVWNGGPALSVPMFCSADERTARKLRGVFVHALGRVLRALRCDVIAVSGGEIWTST